MHVKLRLARWGARNNPLYGIVAAPVRMPRDGRHLERLGSYNPIPYLEPDFTTTGSTHDPQGKEFPKVKTKHIELNADRIKYWLSVGATPTPRVHWILSKAGILPPTPKQLQATGHVSLSDKTTWDIQVVDASSQEPLATLTGDEARELFVDKRLLGMRHRLKEEKAATPPGIPLARSKHLAELDWAILQMDGTFPSKGNLNETEQLYILKKFLYM